MSSVIQVNKRPAGKTVRKRFPPTQARPLTPIPRAKLKRRKHLHSRSSICVRRPRRDLESNSYPRLGYTRFLNLSIRTDSSVILLKCQSLLLITLTTL